MSSAEPSARDYLPIVDFLRAVAVLAVVGYHIGLPFLPGGFVGVDVFFVISGFLIIGHIVAEQERGNFSFGAFYARRALRILPPYFLVIAVCIAIAPFVFVLPTEWEQFSQEVMWSAVMAANYFFLGQQGYFDAASDTKVLLHLWSLAVEEQFYIVAPLLLAGLWAGFRRWPGKVTRGIGGVLVALLFLVSLMLCIRFTDPDVNHAFYQMPLRAWEFIAGGVLGYALPYARRLPSLVLHGLLLIGIALIAGAVLGFSPDTPFPSYGAVIPVAGACLVIVSGLSLGASPLVRILTLPPVLWVGLVSYSFYLWHWPLLTFTRIYNFGDASLWRDLFMGGVVALILAAATYYLIERPIKEWRRVARPKLTWRYTGAGLVGSALVLSLGLAVPRAFSATEAGSELIAMLDDRIIQPDICDFRVEPDPELCASARNGAAMGLLLGDSHAAWGHVVYDKYARESGSILASGTHNGCAPIFDVIPNPPSDRDEECWAFKENNLRPALPEMGASYAIIQAHWWIYVNGRSRQLYIPGVEPDRANRHHIFPSYLRTTLEELHIAGIERILIIATSPMMPADAPLCLLRARHYGVDEDARCSTTLEESRETRDTPNRMIAEAVEGLDFVRVIDPTNALCDEDGTCFAHYYTDDDHLNSTGFEAIYRENREAFEWVFAASGT